MEILKNFVVLEGIDGSGTTTQLNILETFFHQNRRNYPLFYKTAEPTNGSIGKIIRSALKKEISLMPETIAMLFAADRNEHLFGPNGITEHCQKGELVVSDRYILSSLVYQGITCREDLPARLNSNFPSPELLLFLDIDPEIASKRIAGRGNREIYEYLDFQIQVRQRYKSLLPQLSAGGIQVHTIDASPSPEKVAREVWSAIIKMPIFKG